jgi:hypothetical protein
MSWTKEIEVKKKATSFMFVVNCRLNAGTEEQAGVVTPV